MTTSDRRYRLQDDIGTAKYTISFYDGKKQHPDGSPFYDISIFRNKRLRDRFVSKLRRAGYASD